MSFGTKRTYAITIEQPDNLKIDCDNEAEEVPS